MEREPGRKRWSVYRTPRDKSGETPESPARPVAKQKPEIATRAVVRPGVSSRAGMAVAGLIVFAVAGAVIGFSVLVSNLTDDADAFGGKSEVQVLTEDGVEDLVAAVEEKTGSTEVFSATIYPTYAVVRVPADRSSQREIGYYWDGHDLEPWGGKGTSSYERFDLAGIDAAVLTPLVKEARAAVDDANSWYVIIDHTPGEKGWISAYASNEYSEGGYILADRRGREIERHGW